MQYGVVAGKITIESVQGFLQEVNAIAQSNNTTIQAADATKIAGRRHVDCAVRNAVRSFRDHRNIATDLGVEILLHLSACRQIRHALEIGVHEGEMDVLLVVVGAKKSIDRTAVQLSELIRSDSRVMEYDETKNTPLMHTFNITKQEIAAAGGDSRIPDLVQERLVLFDAFR